jgi:hypothetical protein
MVTSRPDARIATLDESIGELEARARELGRILQRNRRVHRKLAELVDVVRELILAEEAREEDTLLPRLRDYLAGR